MNLTVCATSTGTDLTTLANVKERLGLVSATGDALLSALIRRASAAAESYVGQPLSRALYQEALPAYGGRNLMVSRTPIRNVTRVMSATSTSLATIYTSSEYRIEDAGAGLISRDEGWAWTAPTAWAMTEIRPARAEERPYVVEYEAGYLLEGSTSTAYGTTSTERTLPEDIEAAVIETAAAWWMDRRRPASVSSHKAGDLAVTYTSESEGAQGLPLLSRSLLDPYRRRA